MRAFKISVLQLLSSWKLLSFKPAQFEAVALFFWYLLERDDPALVCIWVGLSCRARLWNCWFRIETDLFEMRRFWFEAVAVAAGLHPLLPHPAPIPLVPFHITCSCTISYQLEVHQHHNPYTHYKFIIHLTGVTFEDLIEPLEDVQAQLAYLGPELSKRGLAFVELSSLNDEPYFKFLGLEKPNARSREDIFEFFRARYTGGLSGLGLSSLRCALLIVL